jgi:hypothetical protein
MYWIWTWRQDIFDMDYVQDIYNHIFYNTYFYDEKKGGFPLCLMKNYRFMWIWIAKHKTSSLSSSSLNYLQPRTLRFPKAKILYMTV